VPEVVVKVNTNEKAAAMIFHHEAGLFWLVLLCVFVY